MIDPSARIHPSADLEDAVAIGPRTAVWQRAQIRGGASIGADAIIGRDAFIDEGVVLGDRVKVQNGALVYHGVTVGDGVFIGPSDLSASLGFLGQPRHPEVRRVIEDACRRARAIRKPIGILAPVEEDATAWLAMGFGFVAVGGDILCLRKAVDALAERFRAPRPEPA